ncbi:AEC family transporter [Martelella alba]|uniref:AEC family transporter n=1 Tax=Martelella alba TaxID=2590451 RepID=A0A506UDM9_9HYPH|nr:AEC family transporter [Martelella alba]TPW30769.1 AEC family transporter [Martelella alba]
MQDIVNSVLPLFILILIGWAIVRINYFKADHAGMLTSFVFKIALPMLLMRTVAEANFADAKPLKIWLCYFAAIAVSWTTAALIARRFFGRDRASGVIIGLSGTFANAAFIGIPLVSHVVGSEGLIVLSLVLAIHMPVMMVTATVLVEHAKSREGGAVSAPRQIAYTVAHNLVTSPIVVGLFFGAMIHLFNIQLGGPVLTVIDMIASMAAPVALIAIGMTLTQYKVSGNVGLFSVVTFIKLMLVPALVYLFAVLLGLPPAAKAALVLTGATPAGVNSFVLANQFGTGKNVAASTITLTTALGVFTVSFWVLILGL